MVRKGLKYQLISDKNSKGYIDTLGNVLIALGKYRFLNPIDEQGMILATKGKKEGFIDINGNVLIPFIYDDLGVFTAEDSCDLAPAARGGKQGFINREGEIVIPFEYDYRSSVRYFYEPGVAVLSKAGRFGAIDTQNKVVLPFVYDDLDHLKNNNLLIAYQGDCWLPFSTLGKQLSDARTDVIKEGVGLNHLPQNPKNLPILVVSKESEKRLRQAKNELRYLNGSRQQQCAQLAKAGVDYAYLDSQMKELVCFGTYDYAEVFGLGRKAIVAKNGKYGIINEYGELQLPLAYDFVERPQKYSAVASFFLASKKDSIVLYDENLNRIRGIESQSYVQSNKVLILTNAAHKKGMLDFSARLVAPFAYDTLYQEDNTDKYIARKDGAYGWITSQNEIILPFKYKRIFHLGGAIACVDEAGKMGAYSKTGELIIPFQYDAIYDAYYDQSFPNKDIYIASKNGRVGTIDNQNKVVIPFQYDALSGWVEFGPDAHFAKCDGKYGVISHQGEVIIPLKYDYVSLPEAGIVAVRKGGKYGVLSWKNKVVLPLEYDAIIIDVPLFDFGGGGRKVIVARRGNVWKYFAIDGKLQQDKVPLEEINEKYNYILNSPIEPSNESHDFDLKYRVL